MKIVEYIKENWSSLPKSKFNELEVVIFREMKNDDWGYGHHVYEGYGVSEDGELLWCYSSGCSCNGSADGGIVSEKNLKIFELKHGSISDIDPTEVNFSNLEVEYNDY